MPLTNFGSILNFAEELEACDQKFYETAAGNPACQDYKDALNAFAADAKKNVKTVQRTRRENVTEMILEPIKDFTREPYQCDVGNASGSDAAAVLAAAKAIEERALNYYTDAAVKIKALPEVARALKMVAKKRTAHLKKLDTL